MLDKLIQAAIITFLLNLVLSVSSNSTIPSKGLPSLVEKPNAMPATKPSEIISLFVGIRD
jgi:hypothetical protein